MSNIRRFFAFRHLSKLESNFNYIIHYFIEKSLVCLAEEKPHERGHNFKFNETFQ